MDHEAICDCPFLARCETFRDRLIDPTRKRPNGFGCRWQSDLYRKEHCQTFRCMYLSMVLAEALRAGAQGPATIQA